ncbi:hypothetical protein [Streptomyces sp. NPDC127197]|uniref:hypothetical protein n=1 Tax=Streptomyces sp. NPDC127197 TaxID=3345388 RepID=UPI003636760D
MNAFLTAAAFVVLIAAAAYVIHQLNLQHADRIAVHRYSAPCPAAAAAARRSPRWDRTGPSRRPLANGGTTATAAAAAFRRAAAAAVPLTAGDQPVSITGLAHGPSTRLVPTRAPANVHPAMDRARSGRDP